MVGSRVIVGVPGVKVSGVRLALGAVDVFLGVGVVDGVAVRVAGAVLAAGMSAGGAAQAASRRVRRMSWVIDFILRIGSKISP